MQNLTRLLAVAFAAFSVLIVIVVPVGADTVRDNGDEANRRTLEVRSSTPDDDDRTVPPADGSDQRAQPVILQPDLCLSAYRTAPDVQASPKLVTGSSGSLLAGNCPTSQSTPTPTPTPSPPPFSQVIQLGDSYSSGVGALPANPPIDFGPHVCADPHYFRDEVTPGIRVADDLGVPSVFVGCSGTMAQTSSPGLSFDDQVDALIDAGYAQSTSGGTDTLIVYSIGGNDLTANGENWTTGLLLCLLPDNPDAPGVPCQDNPTASDWAALRNDVGEAHAEILSAFPNATVRVMGYPLLANRAPGTACEIGPFTVDGVDFGLTLTNAEADLFDAINIQLNQELSAVVDSFATLSNADIQFVDHASVANPGACQHVSQNEHVQPYALNGSDVSVNSFHPTPAGYQAMYAALAANLGLSTKPLNTSTGSASCSGAAASSVKDPWGARMPNGVNVRGTVPTDVLNGSLVLDNVQTMQIVVDMLGEPVGSANIETYVEVPGGSPVSVSLSPRCYQGDSGADRGFYTGTVSLRTNEPATSIVARLRDVSGNLIAGAHSGVASVERIESQNTLETIGVRMNDSTLDELADYAEFELERVMEAALQDVSPNAFDIWVADVSGVNVNFTPLAPGGATPNGGLRAQVGVADLEVVVRGPLGWERCNWRVSQGPSISASVDLAFDPTPGAPPLSVVNLVTGFPILSFTIENAATQEVQLCGAMTATILADIAAIAPNIVLNNVLLGVNLDEGFWLAPVNLVLDAWIDSQVDPIISNLAARSGISVGDAVSISSLGADPNGVFVSAALTLPGGPVADDAADQAISTSLTRNTAQGDPFDAAMFIELAAINRALALGARPYSMFNSSDFTIYFDLDGDGADERIRTNFTAAPYVTRKADGTPCAGFCAEINAMPIRATVSEPGPAGSRVWLEEVVFTVDGPIELSTVSVGADPSLDFTWNSNLQVAASVIHSADGSDTVSGLLTSDLETLVELLLPGLVADLLPSSLTMAEDTPEEIGEMNPTISASVQDVTGNTDLQLLFDFNHSPFQIATPLCDGVPATIVGTPFDDVIEGTSGHDVIHALDGNDLVEGGGGNDIICGGDGRGILDGEQGADRIFGAHSEDFIRGGSDDDVAWAGGGDDFLIGDGGRDWLDGSDGNDTVLGQDGSDIELKGGNGHDLVEGGSGDDLIRGGSGNDTLIGGSNFETFSVDQDTIYGDAGNDFIDGGDRDDTIYAGDGDDNVDGGAGRDDIWGGNGNDTLRGGPDSVLVTDNDSDDIWGEAGDDIIRGGARSDDIWGGSGNDTGIGGSGNDWCSSDTESQHSC